MLQKYAAELVSLDFCGYKKYEEYLKARERNTQINPEETVSEKLFFWFCL